MNESGSWFSKLRPGEFVPIHSESPGRNLVGAGVMLLAAIGQAVGLVRYVRRLPEDHIGIGLYVTTGALFVLMTVLLFRKWRRLRGSSD